jgi:hypothetical protein
LNEKVTLVPLTPEQCFLRWEWLRAGLLVCISKTKARHLPEDVYARIRANTAWAYVIEAPGDEVGFIVFTTESDPDGKVLFIWQMYCLPGSIIDLEQHLFDEIDSLARKVNAIRVRMKSPRKGWGKHLGFKPVCVEYDREV